MGIDGQKERERLKQSAVREKLKPKHKKTLKNLKKMSTTFASNISSDGTEKTQHFSDRAQEHHKGEKSSLPLRLCLDDLARLILQTRPDY